MPLLGRSLSVPSEVVAQPEHGCGADVAVGTPSTIRVPSLTQRYQPHVLRTAPTLSDSDSDANQSITYEVLIQEDIDSHQSVPHPGRHQHTARRAPDMALIRLRGSCERLRGSCEDGNTCPTLIYDTTTGAVGVQAQLDPDATARLTAPDGEAVV